MYAESQTLQYQTPDSIENFAAKFYGYLEVHPDACNHPYYGAIDYEQLYAQVLYELQVQKSPYWYNNAEVARIQELNLNYMEKKDIADIISICFRKPEPGEPSKSMNCDKLLEVITSEYPSVKVNHSTKIYLGRAMKALGYESTDRGHVAHYKVVPVKVA